VLVVYDVVSLVVPVSVVFANALSNILMVVTAAKALGFHAVRVIPRLLALVLDVDVHPLLVAAASVVLGYENAAGDVFELIDAGVAWTSRLSA
jgi:hypothetical protein